MSLYFNRTTFTLHNPICIYDIALASLEWLIQRKVLASHIERTLLRYALSHLVVSAKEMINTEDENVFSPLSFEHTEQLTGGV